MKSQFNIMLVVLLTISFFSQAQNFTDTASLPNYELMKQPFKISGVLYMSDGVTPAKDYLVTINQPNEEGDFLVDTNNKLITSATIKTNAKGEYTFYTYIPGSDRLYNKLKEIFMKVETPDGDTYAMPTLLFDNDSRLNKQCRKRIAKKSDISRILKLKKVYDNYEVYRDMKLSLDLDRIN